MNYDLMIPAKNEFVTAWSFSPAHRLRDADVHSYMSSRAGFIKKTEWKNLYRSNKASKQNARTK
jgi:hypothetical protein